MGVFFVHHVEASDKVTVLLSFQGGVKHGNDVGLSNDLEPTVDDGQSEVGNFLLNLRDDSVEDFALFLNTDGISIIIHNTVENVSQFNDDNMLVNERPDDLVQDILKELGVVVELQAQHELVLEVAPDDVGLLALDLLLAQNDLLFKVLIKSLSGRPVLSQLVALDEAFFVELVLGDLEEVQLLVVIDAFSVGELDQIPQWTGGCQVKMMNDCLWHFVQSFEQL